MDRTIIIILSKQLAEESEGQFTCPGENTEKFIPFSVPLKKLIKMEKNLLNY